MRFESEGSPLSVGEDAEIEIGDSIRRGDIVWFDRVAPQKLVMRIASATVEAHRYRIDRGHEPDVLRLIAVDESPPNKALQLTRRPSGRFGVCSSAAVYWRSIPLA
jgi:hypothetical protein